jgi:hypothetical protein
VVGGAAMLVTGLTAFVQRPRLVCCITPVVAAAAMLGDNDRLVIREWLCTWSGATLRVARRRHVGCRPSGSCVGLLDDAVHRDLCAGRLDGAMPGNVLVTGLAA